MPFILAADDYEGQHNGQDQGRYHAPQADLLDSSADILSQGVDLQTGFINLRSRLSKGFGCLLLCGGKFSLHLLQLGFQGVYFIGLLQNSAVLNDELIRQCSQSLRYGGQLGECSVDS